MDSSRVPVTEMVPYCHQIIVECGGRRKAVAAYAARFGVSKWTADLTLYQLDRSGRRYVSWYVADRIRTMAADPGWMP